MTDLAHQLAEDRAMRDSARALLDADIRHIKGDLSEQGVGERLTHRVANRASHMTDEAIDLARDNRGAVSAGIAAILLFFLRGPILDWLGLAGDDEGYGDDEDYFETDSDARRSDYEPEYEGEYQ